MLVAEFVIRLRDSSCLQVHKRAAQTTLNHFRNLMSLLTAPIHRHTMHTTILFNSGSSLNLKMHYPNFKGHWVKSRRSQVKPIFSCPHGLRSPFMKSAPESWQLYGKSHAALDEVSGDIALFIPQQWDFDEPNHSPFCHCTSLTLACSRARYYTGSCHLAEAKLALIQLPVHCKEIE